MLSSFMQAFVHELFPAIDVEGCYQFRVTRNSDLLVSEDDITDLREALQGELPARHFGDTVRLGGSASNTPPAGSPPAALVESGLTRQDLYQVNGPVNPIRLMQFPIWSSARTSNTAARAAPRSRGAAAGLDLFEVIRQRDLLLHHPFDCFTSVVDSCGSRRSDPRVLAIKQTLYRTGDEIGGRWRP